MVALKHLEIRWIISGARQASGPGFRIGIPLKERSGVYDLRLFSTGVWDDRSI